MSLRVRLLLAIGYVLVVALVAFEVPLAINTSNRIDSEIRAQASAQADLLSVAAAEELPEGAGAIDPLVDVAAEAVRGRVIVVDDRGRLISDSAGEKAGADFSSRPEIQSALAGESFQGERESTALDMELTATSAPMLSDGEIVGAVRITQSSEAESRAVIDSVGGLALIGLIVLAIGLIAALIVARQSDGAAQGDDRVGGTDRRRRPQRAGSPERQQRAAHAGPRLQLDDREARGGAAEPAPVRGRRLPPAADPDHRPAAAARGSPRGAHRWRAPAARPRGHRDRCRDRGGGPALRRRHRDADPEQDR